MKTKTSKHVKGHSGSLFGRVQVGSQVGAGDGAIAGTLDVQDALCGDTVVYPFGDRLWRNTNGTREVGLGPERLENAGENVVAHTSSLIHRRFIDVNGSIIAHHPVVDEATLMEKRNPQPDNYADFAAWMRAACNYAGSQAELARKVGISPQQITRYLKGGGADSMTIGKLAAWAGVPYAKLLLLIDGNATAEMKNVRDRPSQNQTTTPLGAQIGRQWEQIQDEAVQNFIAQQIQHELDRQNQARGIIEARKRKIPS